PGSGGWTWPGTAASWASWPSSPWPRGRCDDRPHAPARDPHLPAAALPGPGPRGAGSRRPGLAGAPGAAPGAAGAGRGAAVPVAGQPAGAAAGVLAGRGRGGRMTRDEIRALPAGRELDALVAERVMGWAFRRP